MRQVTLSSCVVLCAGALCAVVAAQQTQAPVFRTEVDAVRLDVSVLDRNRRPMRGLTQRDFRVYEDGKLQELLAVAEFDTASIDPPPSAWIRFTPRDVEANNLQDQAGDGRVIAIVIDDCNSALNWLGVATVAREIGHLIVDRLGTSDVGAVVFVTNIGKTQEFTEDRGKLHDAIDTFDRSALRAVIPNGRVGVPLSAASPAPDGCTVSRSLVNTLDTVTSRLATIANRRKTIFVITPGVEVRRAPVPQGPANMNRPDPMEPWQTLFWKAQRGNVNIYPIDPSGERRVGNNLTTPLSGGAASSTGVPISRPSPASAIGSDPKSRRELVLRTAEETGGRAILSTRDFDQALDGVFDEAGSYYLVGYRSSNAEQDGRFRKIEVKVAREGAIVRTRTGYVAQKEGRITTAEAQFMPSSRAFASAGLERPAALPLRAAVFPLGPSADANGLMDVAVVLTTRLPPLTSPVAETLNIVRTLYDADGRAGTPLPETARLALVPYGSDEVRYDVYQRLALAPGSYSIRLNGTSAALDKSGSVYVDFDVPDLARGPLSVSPIVIGTRASGERNDVLASILPIVPTTIRSFTPGDHPAAFVRVGQPGATPLQPASVNVRILDIYDATVHESTQTVDTGAFAGLRSAPFELTLPLAGLSPGPYLLTIEVALPGNIATRRDLVFRVR